MPTRCLHAGREQFLPREHGPVQKAEETPKGGQGHPSLCTSRAYIIRILVSAFKGGMLRTYFRVVTQACAAKHGLGSEAWTAADGRDAAGDDDEDVMMS